MRGAVSGIPATVPISEAVEFSVSIRAGSNAGKMVVGTSEIDGDYDSLVEKVEYYEVKDSQWHLLSGIQFGPAQGFPLSDATSKFRVTFKAAGTLKVTFKLQTVDTQEVVWSQVVDFNIKGN